MVFDISDFRAMLNNLLNHHIKPNLTRKKHALEISKTAKKIQGASIELKTKKRTSLPSIGSHRYGYWKAGTNN